MNPLHAPVLLRKMVGERLDNGGRLGDEEGWDAVEGGDAAKDFCGEGTLRQMKAATKERCIGACRVGELACAMVRYYQPTLCDVQSGMLIIFR